jgi:V/A-type H+-transporting ATPase subunit I
MFTPERMHQINVLIFESELDDVAREIVRLGILHLVRLDDQEPWAENLKSFEAGAVRSKIEYLRGRLALLMKNLDIKELSLDAGAGIAEVSMGDIAEMEKYVVSLEHSIEGVLVERTEIKQKLERMEAIASEVAPLMDLGFPIEKAPYSFLEWHYGEVRFENVEYIREKIATLPAVLLSLSRRDKTELILLIGLKNDRLKIKRILREASFDEVEIGEDAKREAAEVKGELGKKIEALESELAGVQAELAGARDANAGRITEYNRSLRVAALLLRVKNFLKRTRKTYIFSGWIPSGKKREVEREILRAAKGRAIIEVVAPEDVAGVKAGRVKVPVLLKHPAFFKPFEMLVSNYGLPEYKVIDPTFFFAITYLVMFGMMFGDVGHGAVILLLGAWLGFRSKQKNESVALVGRLAFYCGVSSVVFGFLFGSVFGLEELIPHVWMKPMNNVIYFFKVAIYFGIGVISLGIVFHVINSIRMRHYKATVFDHAGLIVAIMYWGGIVAVSIFLSNEPIPEKLLIGAIGVPILLLFFREPILALASRRKMVFETGVGSYIFESVIEVVEILIGYLANTVSFIRVAAFSLAHVGLFIAVFSLVDMVKGKSGGMIYSILILVLGNVGIIALEGLVVTIQAIRLEYYEFFGKFFSGGGVAYKPIGLGVQPGRDE